MTLGVKISSPIKGYRDLFKDKDEMTGPAPAEGHPPPVRHAPAEDLPAGRHLHLQALLPFRQGREGRQAAELRAVPQGRGDAGTGR